MTQFTNLRGTSEQNFRVGIVGPTIYTGSDDPNVTGPTPIDTINLGDVYFRSGGSGDPFFYDGTQWNQAVSVGTGGTVINGNTLINGNLSVTGQGLFADGSAAAPSISFILDTDTGIYRRNTDSIGFSANGVERFYIEGNQLRAPQLRFRTTSGSPSLPSYGFDTDANTGMYHPAANSIGFSTGSNLALLLDAAGDGFFSDDLTVQGDFTVNGTTTTVNSANLAVADNIITINDGEGGAGVSLVTAGIEIDRGSLPFAGVIWDDALDQWTTGLLATPVTATRQPDGTRAAFEVLTTDAIQFPSGTTAQRPSLPVNGMSRYNITLDVMESYVAGAWENIATVVPGTATLIDTNNLSDLTNVTQAITNLGLNSGGANDIWVDTAGDTMTGDLVMNGAQIRSSGGTAAIPGYGFTGDANTGMYSTNPDQLSFTTGGVQRFVIRNQNGSNATFDLTANDAIRLPIGTTAQRPSTPLNGMTRYNTTTDIMESFVNGSWQTMSSTVAGSATLVNTNNLSDLTNVTQAITNLGLNSGGANDIWVDTAGDTMTGNLVMSGAARHLNTAGTVGDPSYTFASDPNTGMYRPAADQLGFALGGTLRLQMRNQNGVNASFNFATNDAIQMPNGSTAQRPSTPINGMMRYNETLDTMESYVNGAWENVSTATAGTTTLINTNNLSDLTNVTQAITNLGLNSGGANDIWVDVAGDTMTGNLNMTGTAEIRAIGGNATDPGLNFTGDTNTGIYNAAANAIGFSAGGVERMLVSSTQVRVSEPITANANNTLNIGTNGVRFNTVFATTFNGEATSALYADLAERYEADAEYPEGTILVIGGDKEVTTTDSPRHHAVAGLVSLRPAFMMNNSEEREDDPLWPFLALAGRVPCRVVGTVSKGDRVGTSTIHGVATSLEGTNVAPGSVVGIAMQDYDGEVEGLIEVMVRSA